jgi:transcriptional regulator with XRE-family HTH domain
MPRTATSEVAAKLVGQAIRKTRTEAKLTQADVAARLGVSAAYVTNVEAGRGNVTIGQLAHIAEAMGAAMDIALPLVDQRPVVIRRRSIARSGG